MGQVNRLSERENEVVKLLLRGKSNKQIALTLGISERTVEFHLKNVYTKLYVSSKIELILKLGNTTGSPIAEILGNSTVESLGEYADNRDKRDSLMNWAKSFRDNISIIGMEPEMKKRWIPYFEWVLAVFGAILCIGGAAIVWIPQASSNPPGFSLWPLPALLLIEIAALGLAGFIGVVLDNGQHSSRWGIVIWIACGGLTALAVIGAFSVSVVVLLAVPALLFGGAAILADIRQHRKWLTDLGILIVSAVANFTLIFALISIARI